MATPILNQAFFFPEGPGVVPNDNAPQRGGDGTATGGTLVKAVNGVAAGTNGNDVINLDSLKYDKDQVIKTGAGDDLFRWNGSQAAKEPGINGVVKFGADAAILDAAGNPVFNADGVQQFGKDTVVLANQLEDYKFTLRADGGIKVQYVGTNHDIDGAAVTFYGADVFTFRNISDGTGGDNTPAANTDFQNLTFTTSELVALIATNQTI